MLRPNNDKTYDDNNDKTHMTYTCYINIFIQV